MANLASLQNFTNAAAITPSDSTLLDCAAVYVGGAGNLAVMPSNQSTAVTLVAVPVGAVLNISCQKIMATNTTATNIVALW